MNISPAENMQMAVHAVWNHRFRSLLTILGIVIGITTVVTVASLLTGLREGVVVFFQNLARTTSSSTAPPATPARTRRIPRSASRRPLKPEYADTSSAGARRWPIPAWSSIYRRWSMAIR